MFSTQLAISNEQEVSLPSVPAIPTIATASLPATLSMNQAGPRPASLAPHRVNGVACLRGRGHPRAARTRSRRSRWARPQRAAPPAAGVSAAGRHSYRLISLRTRRISRRRPPPYDSPAHPRARPPSRPRSGRALARSSPKEVYHLAAGSPLRWCRRSCSPASLPPVASGGAAWRARRNRPRADWLARPKTRRPRADWLARTKTRRRGRRQGW